MLGVHIHPTLSPRWLPHSASARMKLEMARREEDFNDSTSRLVRVKEAAAVAFQRKQAEQARDLDSAEKNRVACQNEDLQARLQEVQEQLTQVAEENKRLQDRSCLATS